MSSEWIPLEELVAPMFTGMANRRRDFENATIDNYREFAACAAIEMSATEEDKERGHRLAKVVCSQCYVPEQCLLDGIRERRKDPDHPPDQIYGGMTPRRLGLFIGKNRDLLVSKGLLDPIKPGKDDTLVDE